MQPNSVVEMADSETSPISKAVVADIKTTVDEGKAGLGKIVEDGPAHVDSVVKPFVERFTHAADSLVHKVADSSSSYVTQVGKQVEEKIGLLSSSLAHAPKSSDKATEETLPTSDKSVGDSSEAVESKPRSAETEEAGLDETPRATHTQPFIAVSATTSRASWINCCGLLDVLKRDQ